MADAIPDFRIPNNGCFERTTVRNFQTKLLKEQLSKAKKALAEHESKIYENRNVLKSVLLSKLLPSVLLFIGITVFNTRKNVEVAHTKNWKICRKNKGVHYLIYMILRT